MKQKIIRHKNCFTVFMGTKKNIPQLFGFTQEVVAMLLRIRRGQWSLYELGLRSLPFKASQKLNQIHLVVLAADKTIEKSETDEQKAAQLGNLKKMLDENNYQQQALSRKIKDFENKYKKDLSLWRLTQHLVGDWEYKTPYDTELLALLERKAIRNLEKNGPFQLRQLQIRLKTLQYEESLLRAEIGE